jgi:Mrp family chromosome partitioning ATPase
MHFNIEQEKGLSDYLLDGTDIGGSLVKTDIDKLSLLPAGRQVSNPAELLSSKKMKKLMVEMKSRYSDRYILFDTPPVLPMAETRSMSRMVDGVLLVVREGIASLQHIQHAIDIIHKDNVLGILYNAVSPENLNGYHKNYYTNYTDYVKKINP